MGLNYDNSFQWNDKRRRAAALLADGYTQQQVADDEEISVSRATICNWVAHPDFAAEVDRLTWATAAAHRAARLRIANRVIREKMRGDRVNTRKDLLEWLKYAQSETDGINTARLNIRLEEGVEAAVDEWMDVLMKALPNDEARAMLIEAIERFASDDDDQYKQKT